MSDAEFTGLESFDRFVASYKNAGPELRKDMRAVLRKAAPPLVDELKTVAAGLTVTGDDGQASARKNRSGGGSRQRAVYDTAKALRNREKKGKLTDKAIDRTYARKRGTSGLRAKVASGIKYSVTERKGELVAKVKTTNTNLPPEQRVLVRRLNRRKGWRHPLFGDRKKWYTSKVFPAAWWMTTSEKHQERARAYMEQAFNAWADKLNKP